MQKLAGIQLNELYVNNPHKVFKINGYEYDDGEIKIINLLDKNGNDYGWWGYYSYLENPNIVQIEFVLDEEGDQEQLDNLMDYCKKYRIKYNKILNNVNDPTIEIPIKNIDMNKIDEEI